MSSANETAATRDIGALEYASLHDRPSRWGKGFLAVAATFVLPGLGHLIAGRPKPALFWLLLFLFMSGLEWVVLINPRLISGLLVLAPVQVLILVWMYVSALFSGRRSTRQLLKRPWLRYAAGIALIVGAAWFGPHALLAHHLALHTREHYVEAFVLSGRAMSPTLVPGDHFLVHKKVALRRWDPAAIEHPDYRSTRAAMRIVGLPGETIEIIRGRVHVNGTPANPPAGVGPYLSLSEVPRDVRVRYDGAGAGCEGSPIFLASDEYFVLGDNTGQSLDARLWKTAIPGHQVGALPHDHIKGRITAIYWPPSRWRMFE